MPNTKTHLSTIGDLKAKRKARLAIFLLPFLLASCGGPTSSSSSEISSISSVSESSSIPAPDAKLILYRDSRAYLKNMKMEDSLPLRTFHYLNDDDTPYVSIMEYLAVVENVKGWEKGACRLRKDGDVYILSVKKGNTSYDCFSFNVPNKRITIEAGSVYFYERFDMDHIGGGKTNANVRVNTEKTKQTFFPERQVIDVTRYGLNFEEMSGELYAPYDMLGLVFGISNATTLPNVILYNGLDYYHIYNDGTTSACYSGELKFRYADPAILALVLAGYSNTGLPGTFPFTPKTAAAGEKYRFESAVMRPGLIAKQGETPRKLIPDFYTRMVLLSDGTGTYQYFNAETNEPFTLPDLGFKDDLGIAYAENDAEIRLSITSVSPILGPSVSTEVINKGKTFYLTPRSEGRALYEYNLLRLHFGEFYGLKETHPEVHDDIDWLLTPYRADLLSPSYDKYQDAMGRFLMEAIDDGHTSLDKYSLFGGIDAPADLSTRYVGLRRSRLLDLRRAYQAARGYAGKKTGFEIVGETAYLTFDQFMTTFDPLSGATGDPNSYVDTNVCAFAKTAMEETKKHEEVKRVVFDLTCNGGGQVVVMPFLLGVMSKDPYMVEYDYASMQRSITHYDIDLNGDGFFATPEDTYEGQYEFYVLTSDMSFSCANAFPGNARNAGTAKIIGLRSGGGAAAVNNCHMPNGYSFKTSSLEVEATTDEEGNYVENDEGIPLDLCIEPSIWYDREAMNSVLAEAFPLA